MIKLKNINFYTFSIRKMNKNDKEQNLQYYIIIKNCRYFYIGVWKPTTWNITIKRAL